MYKTIEIDDMFGISSLLSEQVYRQDLDRYRNIHIYRGMCQDFNMMPSLHRICKSKRKELEPAILSKFTKYAMLEDPTIETSVWRQMVLGQHHGLPTRLLDWSFSPLVALHFATTENDLEKMDEHDCVVWRIDVNELHERLPEKYKSILGRYSNKFFSLKMMQDSRASLEQYDKDMNGQAMLVVEPPSIEQRIINQYSFFTVVPLDITDVVDFLRDYTENSVKYVIKKELRWRVRDMLDQLNVSERIMYPGLDGLSSWLARYYFVKDGIE